MKPPAKPPGRPSRPPGPPLRTAVAAQRSGAAPAAPVQPLSERELDELQALLDGLPAGHESLDVVMIDGYLCGVLLQPRLVPQAAWLPPVIDLEGRPAPAGFATPRLAALLARRHAELNRAIERRDWFDPWVYQLDEDASPSETVLPWVAGFSVAMEAFPQLMQQHEAALLEPLATLYRHFDPDDLEDADELLAEIETLELPADLTEAVDDLVRSVLLMADVSRPRRSPQRPGGAGPGRTTGARRPRGGPPRR